MIGCSSSNSGDNKETTTELETNEETANEEQNSKEDELEVDESDLGKMTIYKTNTDLNLVQRSGPFIVKILGSRLFTFEPSEDTKFMFDNKDKVTVITLHVEVENTSEETYTIYPNQGTIVTNTKEQVDCHIWLSEEVGGDFIGQVIKKGDINFILDSDPEKIKSVKYIISGPRNRNFDIIGEDIIFELRGVI